MAFKPFEKAPAKGAPAKPAAKAAGGISPKGKGVAPKGNPFAKAAPFAKGGVVKKGSRGC